METMTTGGDTQSPTSSVTSSDSTPSAGETASTQTTDDSTATTDDPTATTNPTTTNPTTTNPTTGPTTTTDPTTDDPTTTTDDPTTTTDEPTGPEPTTMGPTTTADPSDTDPTSDPTSSTTGALCDPPMDDCDDNPMDCEANLQTDPQNCGGCGVACDTLCVSGDCIDAKYVFVTSEAFPGDLDGVLGANAICSEVAGAANLPGVYKAWLGAGEYAPDTQFSQSQARYILPDGTTVANHFVDLTDGTLAHAIDLDEFGDPIDTGTDCNSEMVWSNANSEGKTVSSTHCFNWIVNNTSSTGSIGQPGYTDSRWAQTSCAPRTCASKNHLYCFQQ